MKYGSFFQAIILTSAVVVAGCGSDEKPQALHNDEGRAVNMTPTEIPSPEPTEAPTPTPKDSSSDTIYSTHGNFSVSYGEAEWKDGILIYKTVEVQEGESPQDIIWLMPSGVIVVSDKYKNRVRKIP